MVFTTSPPDCSLPFINCTITTSSSSNNNSCTKNKNFSSIPRLPPSNPRPLLAKSSGCSPPVVLLEHASSDPPAPLAELTLKFQGFRTVSPPLPETEDINGFICDLFGDVQTEELAYKYYERARDDPKFKPRKTTLKQLIRYLTRSRNWVSIFTLAEDFKNFKVMPDASTCRKLISTCVRARKFRLVGTLLETFKSDHEVSVLAFDSAMKAYNKLHMYRSTVAVYDNMVSSGIVLDGGCYCGIMEAYLKLGNNDKVVSLFKEFESRKKRFSGPFQSEIYWLVCEALGRSGRASEALEFFREMVQKGIPETHRFYATIVSSFSSIRDFEMAEKMLEEADGKGMMVRDPAVFLKLVVMYVEEGLMEKTLGVVEMMKDVGISVSDCISCTIVNGYVKRRGLKAAAEVYEKLISLGCVPGQVTYASIINVHCRLGQYAIAEELFDEMIDGGFDKCVVAYSSMVAMYGKTGRTRDATRLVAKMKEKGCEPNVWVYNTLLDIHGRAMDLAQVDKTWKEMKRRNVVPDKVSYTSVIGVHSRAREFDACINYYREFKLNGGSVDRAMAGIMVSVFSKTNRIDDLVKLLQDMKEDGTKLDQRLYLSSLSALKDAGLQLQAKWLQQNFDKRS